MHLGHASGPYVVADILRRALELRGQQPIYVAGTLGHQEHIAVTAKAEGLSYYQLAERNTRAIKESFYRLQIKTDVFLEPRPTERFHEIVLDLFEILSKAGAVVERETAVPFDQQSGHFVVDGQVYGVCPHCGSHAFGMECEGCGGFVLDSELGSPTNRAGVRLAHKPLRRMFLRLDKLSAQLNKFRNTAILPVQAKSFVDSWLTRGLPEVCVTNPLSEGVRVPLAGYEDQRFTVCFEYVPRHFVAVEEWAARNGRKSSWREIDRQGDIELSIFFGSDNSFGRLLMIPAVTSAVGAESLVPRRCFFNHFLLLDGSKFSTSRNHAVWVNEFADEENSDMVRFFLAMIHPDTQETNFALSEFRAHVAKFWRGDLAALVRSLRLRLQMLGNQSIPPAGTWGRDEIRFYRRIMEIDGLIDHWYRLDTFNPSLIARELELFVRDAVSFGNACEVWPRYAQPDPDRVRTQLRILLCAYIRTAMALYPLCPKMGGLMLDGIAATHPNIGWQRRNWLVEQVQPLSCRQLETIEHRLAHES
jgi:methionyl-tRNA synthetase